MRQVGTLTNQQDALRFLAVLATHDIDATCEVEGDVCFIWVHDEDQLPTARKELKEFAADPSHARYKDADRIAEQRYREIVAQREQARKNVVRMTGKWGQPGSRRTPVVMGLLVIAVILYLYMGLSPENGNLARHWLLFVDPFMLRITSVWQSIAHGEPWRLWTPMLLHGNMLHIVFNSMWMYSLGGQLEDRRGSWYFFAFVLITGAVSNIGQALIEGPFFLGLSGVGYAVFGYLWVRGSMDRSDLALPNGTLVTGLAFLVICILRDVPLFEPLLGGVIPRIANTAHVAGLLSGMLLAWVDAKMAKMGGFFGS
jgi:GlpG protein